MTGTWTLIRLALRRDRIVIPAIVAGLSILAISSAQATIALYSAQALAAGRLQADAAGISANPAFLAMYGPLPTPLTLDAFSVFKTLMMGGIFLGIAVAAIVRRHTRTEEEEGRLELLGAGVLGRRAPLAAAVTVSLLMVAASCLIAAVGMGALGMDGAGTLAFAVAWFQTGLVMTAVTAVAAQVTTTTRGCSAIALGFLGLSFLVRATGDAVSGAGWLTWVSPLGWMTRIQPYGANRFAVALLPVVLALVLVALALALLERRDLGAGLVATRPGPERGSRWLGSSIGLAWRLQYWSLIGWTAALVLGGALIGSLAGSLESMLGDSAMQDLLRSLGGDGPTTLADLFLSVEFAMVGLIVAGYGIAATLRLRTEERDVHAEPLLATPTSRWSFLAGHLLIALAGTTWLLLVLGTTVGLVRGLATGDLAGQLSRLVPAATAPLPAVWICVGLTVVIFGLVPRWTSGAWILLILFLVVGEFGALLGLPDWLREISPFAHLPSLPGGAFTLAPLLTLAIGALALAASGSVGFRRRDLA